MDDKDMQAHKVAITEVINRYFAALDEKHLDVATLSQIFTPDAKVVRPNGQAMTGPQEIGESHGRSMSRFRVTQHLASGFIITLEDERSAAVRANLVAMHVWAEGEGDPEVDPMDNFFLAGGVITGQVRLEGDGWRITEITNEPGWRRGTGFQQVLQTR